MTTTTTRTLKSFEVEFHLPDHSQVATGLDNTVWVHGMEFESPLFAHYYLKTGRRISTLMEYFQLERNWSSNEPTDPDGYVPLFSEKK